MFRERQIFQFGKTSVECLGDPHLGKRFNAGVPLHRRGEREEMVWSDFHDSLDNAKTDLHVCMGDLFDNFSVDDTTIVRAALAYKLAAERNLHVQYFVLMGNHDMSRDNEKMSSFRVFKEIVDGVKNIRVIDSAFIWNSFAFFPYHPFRTSAEVMQTLLNDSGWKTGWKFDAIFGHWDLDSFGEMPHNMFPAELAQTITDAAFTGHVHLPDIRDYGNLELVVVGSMQPYNHSEDPEHKLYVTMTLDTLKATDPNTLRNKCVRVLLGPDDVAPEGLDALQFTTKNLDAPEMDDDLEVVLEDFDFKQIVNKEMELQGVTHPDVLAFVSNEFDRLRAEEMV